MVESLVRGDIGPALHRHELFAEATPEGVRAVATPSVLFQISLQQCAVSDFVFFLQVCLEVFSTAEDGLTVVIASPYFNLTMLVGLMSLPVILAAKCLVTPVPSAAVRLLVSFIVLPESLLVSACNLCCVDCETHLSSHGRLKVLAHVVHSVFALGLEAEDWVGVSRT